MKTIAQWLDGQRVTGWEPASVWDGDRTHTFRDGSKAEIRTVAWEDGEPINVWHCLEQS